MYLSSSRYQLPALWSQPVWVSSLFKLANSRILHNVVVIANPLVIIKTAPNLTKPTLLPLLSLSTWFLSFHLSSLHLASTISLLRSLSSVTPLTWPSKYFLERLKRFFNIFLLDREFESLSTSVPLNKRYML